MDTPIIDANDPYAGSIYNYIKDTILSGIELTEDEMTMAYTNIRLWIDEQSLDPGRAIEFLEQNAAQARAIAMNRAFEEQIIEKEKTSIPPSSVNSDQRRKSRMKLAAIVSVIALALYFLMRESE
jgi:hypothetical protein